MLCAGQIGRPVLDFIQRECQSAHIPNADACFKTVQRRVEEELKSICQETAPLDLVTKENCVEKIGSLLWVNPTDLRNKLKVKMTHTIQSLSGRHPLRASDGTTHRGLMAFIQKEVSLFQQNARPPSVQSSQTEPIPATPAPTKAILWEQPLSVVDVVEMVKEQEVKSKFRFRFIDEWHKVKTTDFFVLKDGKRHPLSLEWFYYLKQNKDGTYTVFWHLPSEPEEEKRSVTFHLKDGHFPGNLFLVVEGNWELEHPTIYGIRLELK